jgi:hypothetical protein
LLAWLNKPPTQCPLLSLLRQAASYRFSAGLHGGDRVAVLLELVPYSSISTGGVLPPSLSATAALHHRVKAVAGKRYLQGQGVEIKHIIGSLSW